MKSLEHLIYDILAESIGVIGRDKPVGMPQGGFAPSFSSRHPNTTINRKRNSAQQKGASPIASFESGGGKNTKQEQTSSLRNPVPNQGDATSIGDLSARGASESGKYKSIRTKLKEMNDLYFVEDETNTTVKKKTKSGDEINKPSDQTEQPHLPSTASDIKNLYHDTMGNLSQTNKKDFSNKEVHPMPVIPFPFAGKLLNLLSKPTEMQPLPRQEAPKQLPPPVSGGSGSGNAPKPAPQAPTSVPQTPKQAPQASTAPPTSAPKQQEMPSPQSQQGTQTKTKEKSDFPPLEPPKPETTENVPTKPGTGSGTGPETPSTTTKLEPKPGNPPESNRQPETNAELSPSPKTVTEPSPSVKPVTGEKPSTAVETKPSTAVDNPLLRGAGAGAGAGGLAAAGGLGALLAYLAGRGGGEKGGVKPSGFLYPNQSEISGFSWTPLGMATNMAKNTPNADKSHILARLSTLIPATKKAKRAGEEPEKVTEEIEMTETAKPNLDKERREVEYVGRKDMIRGKNKNPERKQFHKSTLGKTSAIMTRVIDENNRNNIIKEAISNAVKSSKSKKSENRNSKNSEKMTVGQEKTPVDIHPVLKSPPENQMGRAN